MDTAEAENILSRQINNLKKMTYKQLLRFMDAQETHEIFGTSGNKYQIEIQSFWDSEKKGNLRVVVMIDDGGWHAYFPLSESFIIAPDGSFVGE